jgi:CheY-like chemotaxis protein
MKRNSKKRGAIKSRVILSLSNDVDFDKRLRMAALQKGQIVIRVESVAAALRLIHSDCSGVVLLDLDFAGKNAWEMAGGLLQDPQCPPVMLLTGQGEQFDLRMAVLAGSIFEKSARANGILKIVNDILSAPQTEQARRCTAQREMLPWLTTHDAPAPLIPAHRFCGIVE